MSTQIQNVEKASRNAAATNPETATQPLQMIVDMIRSDCQVEPQEYLDRSEVPHGGE